MRKNENTTLIALLEEHNKNLLAQVGKNKAMSTYMRYDTTKNHVANFVKQRYSKNDLSINDIDTNFIIGFEHYLMKSCSFSINTLY
jgi:hypothetical protein